MSDILNSISAPPLLQSAAASLQGGFNLLNQGAAQVVAATANAPEESNPGVILTARLTNGSLGTSSLQDPLLHGVFDMMQAKTQVEAGAAMMRIYNRTRDDLFSLLAPEPKPARTPLSDTASSGR